MGQLFLPELLGETAYVTSRSPTSDAEISLTVTPTGPTDLAPADTVVSFLLPETEFDAGVIQRFCHFVHFFASRDDSAQWTAEHPGTFLLTVEDGYSLGQLTNRAAFGAVLVASDPNRAAESGATCEAARPPSDPRGRDGILGVGVVHHLDDLAVAERGEVGAQR